MEDPHLKLYTVSIFTVLFIGLTIVRSEPKLFARKNLEEF